MKRGGIWDIRCPQKLKDLFPVRRGYYYKIDRETAKKVVKILSKAYKIPIPKIGPIPYGTGSNAMYDWKKTKILLYNRNHLKSIWHEFYHHLDNMTNHKYISNDRHGGSSSLAWQFADKMWEKFRNI